MQHRLVARPASVVYAAAGAWLVLVALEVAGFGGVIRHDRLLQGGQPLWLATLLFVAGWQVMVLAMMAPSSLHAFASVDSRRVLRFTAGYLAVWTGFGVAIFLGDSLVHLLVNSWMWLGQHPWVIAGTTLVGCGTYQLSGLKSRSLEMCRAAPSKMGAVHGLQCLGSSGGLMLLAFALAASNLLAMAAIAVLMLFEASSLGRTVVKPMGYALIALGVLVLYGPIQI